MEKFPWKLFYHKQSDTLLRTLREQVTRLWRVLCYLTI